MKGDVGDSGGEVSTSPADFLSRNIITINTLGGIGLNQYQLEDLNKSNSSTIRKTGETLISDWDWSYIFDIS